MSANYDGTVTLQLVRKTAYSGSGSGTSVVKNAAAKSSPVTEYVRKQPGRTVVSKSARGA